MDQPERAGSRRTAVADTESVFARYISSLKDQRVAASKFSLVRKRSQLATRLSSSKSSSCAVSGQNRFLRSGLLSARAASEEYNWDLNYGEIAKIFVLAASSVRSSCRKSPMHMPKSADR